MLKKISKLGSVLNKSEQNLVFGGVGPWAVRCNSGVLIENAPDGSAETAAFACKNQGGPSASICSGSNCADQ